MQELVLNIQQFSTAVLLIRKERFLAKDKIIDTRNATDIRYGHGKEN